MKNKNQLSRKKINIFNISESPPYFAVRDNVRKCLQNILLVQMLKLDGITLKVFTYHHWALPGLDHADGRLLHLAALVFSHFQLRQIVRSVFVNVEEDVFADTGS